MVIKQLLELTGAGPWEQKDGTFYLASLLSMNLCSKEKCWYYETRSATEIIYRDSIICPTFPYWAFHLDWKFIAKKEWKLFHCDEVKLLESPVIICSSASNQTLVLATFRLLFLDQCGQRLYSVGCF